MPQCLSVLHLCVAISPEMLHSHTTVLMSTLIALRPYPFGHGCAATRLEMSLRGRSPKQSQRMGRRLPVGRASPDQGPGQACPSRTGETPVPLSAPRNDIIEGLSPTRLNACSDVSKSTGIRKPWPRGTECARQCHIPVSSVRFRVAGYDLGHKRMAHSHRDTCEIHAGSRTRLRSRFEPQHPEA